MARFRCDISIRGTLSNDVADDLTARIASILQTCKDHGLEVRGHGVDVHLDHQPIFDPAPAPVMVAAAPSAPVIAAPALPKRTKG